MNYTSHNIKILRNHFNLTQDDLAIKMNTKRHNIAQWEIGRAHPSIDFIQKMCEMFNIPIKDFISMEIDNDYLSGLENHTTVYFNSESKSAVELVRFLQEELKEKNKIIDKLLEIMKEGDKK